jgi:hypothetical protein
MGFLQSTVSLLKLHGPLSYQFLQMFVIRLELLLHLLLLKGFFHAEDGEFQFEGLDEEVIRPQVHCLNSDIDLSKGGHDDELHVRSHRLHKPQEF